MKWSDWVGPVRISVEPPGYTISYQANDGDSIMEGWYNAGTQKAPKPVFIGQIRGIDHHYTPAKKEAAARMRAACEAHAAQLVTPNSV